MRFVRRKIHAPYCSRHCQDNSEERLRATRICFDDHFGCNFAAEFNGSCEPNDTRPFLTPFANPRESLLGLKKPVDNFPYVRPFRHGCLFNQGGRKSAASRRHLQSAVRPHDIANALFDAIAIAKVKFRKIAVMCFSAPACGRPSHVPSVRLVGAAEMGLKPHAGRRIEANPLTCQPGHNARHAPPVFRRLAPAYRRAAQHSIPLALARLTVGVLATAADKSLGVGLR